MTITNIIKEIKELNSKNQLNMFFKKLNSQSINASEASVCGNGIIEMDEECDEGDGDDGNGGNELCCDPLSCRLKGNSQCSPFNSLCCNERCRFKSGDNPSCTPWSYKNDKDYFCQHENDYCARKEINVNCNKYLASTKIQRASGNEVKKLPVVEIGDDKEHILRSPIKTNNDDKVVLEKKFLIEQNKKINDLTKVLEHTKNLTTKTFYAQIFSK